MCCLRPLKVAKHFPQFKQHAEKSYSSGLFNVRFEKLAVEFSSLFKLNESTPDRYLGLSFINFSLRLIILIKKLKIKYTYYYYSYCFEK